MKIWQKHQETPGLKYTRELDTIIRDEIDSFEETECRSYVAKILDQQINSLFSKINDTMDVNLLSDDDSECKTLVEMMS